MAKQRFRVDRELDHEPTYVVDNEASDDVSVVATFHPHLPYTTRADCAYAVADILNRDNPHLLTDDELEEMKG